MTLAPSFPIRTAAEAPASDFLPIDDRRHRASDGGKMRDSLFWECVVPQEGLALQVYLYLTHANQCGYNVVLWGADERAQIVELGGGETSPDAELDVFRFKGLSIAQPEPGRTASVRYESEKLHVEFDFTGLHAPFSYRQNPDGLPSWFALNRFEQTGWLKGRIGFGGRTVLLDSVGHRDHSWGVRDWGAPQHWKWFIAYTSDASRIVHGWVWIARGEWGFAGYVVRDGELFPVAHMKQRADYTSDMKQRRLDAELTDTRGGVTTLNLDVFGVVSLPSKETIIMEAACLARIDGVAAAAQFETQWGKPYLDHLTAVRQV